MRTAPKLGCGPLIRLYRSSISYLGLCMPLGPVTAHLIVHGATSQDSTWIRQGGVDVDSRRDIDADLGRGRVAISRRGQRASLPW